MSRTVRIGRDGNECINPDCASPFPLYARQVDSEGWCVMCNHCGAGGPTVGSKRAARAAWVRMLHAMGKGKRP